MPPGKKYLIRWHVTVHVGIKSINTVIVLPNILLSMLKTEEILYEEYLEIMCSHSKKNE